MRDLRRTPSARPNRFRYGGSLLRSPEREEAERTTLDRRIASERDPGATQILRLDLRHLAEALALTLVIGACASSQPEVRSRRQAKEITELEQQRAAAVVHRDVDFLDRITAPDSIRILPGGVLETKSQLLVDLKSGALTYSSIDVDELSVNIYGQTAVVAGRSAFTGQKDGKPFTGRCRFSRVWVSKESDWREVAFQLTPIQGP